MVGMICCSSFFKAKYIAIEDQDGEEALGFKTADNGLPEPLLNSSVQQPIKLE